MLAPARLLTLNFTISSVNRRDALFRLGNAPRKHNLIDVVGIGDTLNERGILDAFKVSFV